MYARRVANVAPIAWVANVATREFRIRLARLAAVLGCWFTGGRGGGNCGRPG